MNGSSTSPELSLHFLNPALLNPEPLNPEPLNSEPVNGFDGGKP